MIQRCARRAFLCGENRFPGKSSEHRRGWIRERLKFLASIAGIDCLTYTLLRKSIRKAILREVCAESLSERRGRPKALPARLFELAKTGCALPRIRSECRVISPAYLLSGFCAFPRGVMLSAARRMP